MIWQGTERASRGVTRSKGTQAGSQSGSAAEPRHMAPALPTELNAARVAQYIYSHAVFKWSCEVFSCFFIGWDIGLWSWSCFLLVLIFKHYVAFRRWSTSSDARLQGCECCQIKLNCSCQSWGLCCHVYFERYWLRCHLMEESPVQSSWSTDGC